MMVTTDQIEQLAQQIHAEKSKAEHAFHGQSVVPWEHLGETYKISLLRMAQDRLESTK